MTSQLMDTEPGGEQTQYESVATFTEPHAKSEGQLGNLDNSSNEAEAQQEAEKQEKGEQTAEKIRYGQTISEQGFGGETTESTGSAQQSGYGAQSLDEAESDLTQSRREQGYGPGTNIGA
ncbi:MAG: hypothetical protein MMC23_005980 [Stictis urceolatum]|nr:hypothetical protein [Stictis urceolata]